MSSVSPSSQAPKPMDAAAVKVEDSSPKKVPRKAKIIAREKIAKILGAKTKATSAPTEAKPRDSKRRKVTKEADIAAASSAVKADTVHVISGEPGVIGIIGAYSANEETTAAVAKALDVKAVKAAYKQKEQELFNRRPEEENFLEYLELKLQIERKAAAALSPDSPSLTPEERFELLQSRYASALGKERLATIREMRWGFPHAQATDDKELVTILEMIQVHCPALTTFTLTIEEPSEKALEVISQMTQLTSLSIITKSYIKFSDETEEKLGNALLQLKKLQIFSLAASNAKGAFLKSLSPSVTQLQLNRCEFEAQYVNFSRFTKLQSAELGCMPFTPVSIATLPASLKELHISVSITDALLSHLSKACPNLQSLILENCAQVTGVSFDQLPATLQKFTARYCPITDDGLAKLEHHRLVELTIQHTNAIIGSRFDTLPDSLQLIRFDSLPISDDNIGKLSHLKALEECFFGIMLLKGTKFSELPRTLKKVGVRSRNLTDEAIQGLLKGNHSLEELNMSGLQGTGKYISKEAPQTLRVLTMYGCKRVSDATLGDLSALKQLTYFTATGSALTGLCLQTLPESLQKIDVSECRGLKLENCAALARFQQLRNLDVSGTSVDLAFCAYLPKSIEELYASDWPNISNEIIAILAAKPQLRKLWLAVTSMTKEQLLALPESLELVGLRKLPPAQVRPLRQQRPRLDIR